MLHELYKSVAKIRKKGVINNEEVSSIFSFAKSNFANEWLLYLELFELMYRSNTDLEGALKNNLSGLMDKDISKELIENGLKLIYKNK